MISENQTIEREHSTELDNLNRVVNRAVKNIKPPANYSVSEWADRHRKLSRETSAEAGRWKTSRTPYLRDIMDAFTDPRVHRETIVACSQLGKSECMMNMLGYVIAQDPGSTIWVGPSKEDIKIFTKQRIEPLLRDTPSIRKKIEQGGQQTALLKTFPGGMLKMAGSNSANDLSSTPCRYAFCDERDRWTTNADGNGDPFLLVKARTTTFYNYKMVEVSTPTIKGSSQIADAFLEGTQEYYETKCPDCGEYHFIVFDDIRFKHTKKIVNKKAAYTVESVYYCCPVCGCMHTEQEIKRAEKAWIAQNPDAIKNGHRSFWLNGFMSPWNQWEDLVLQFLNAKDDPEALQTVLNTKFGELWEDRGGTTTDDEVFERREEYQAELPEGVLCITIGVDTQDNRFEYEVVGHGHFRETWGIEAGILMGKPDSEELWEKLDAIISRKWKYADGQSLTASVTFIDSGGHYTQEVYAHCAERMNKRVFAIKGKGGEGTPYTSPPSKVNIVKDNHVIGKTYLYNLGVDSGKERIMSALKVQTAGARYMHFPSNPGKGYDERYFAGLISEKLSYQKNKWVWEKLPGHERNEPLDCRNYAMAAFEVLKPNLEAIEHRLAENREKNLDIDISRPAPKPKRRIKQQKKRNIGSEDW